MHDFKKELVQTFEVNEIFNAISRFSRDKKGNKKGNKKGDFP